MFDKRGIVMPEPDMLDLLVALDKLGKQNQKDKTEKNRTVCKTIRRLKEIRDNVRKHIVF